MENAKNFEQLLSPLQIGSLKIKNRFTMGPCGNAQMYGFHGELKDETIAFYTERAKGGFGLIIQSAQQADDVVDPPNPLSPLGFKTDFPLFQRQVGKLLDGCAAFGTRVFSQVSAGMGRNYPGLRAPSAVEVYKHPELASIEMTKDEIKTKIDSVIEVAKLYKDCGYDGIEVHAMHWGYLLDQFAMSITNHRTDEYGGSLENRMRMAREIITGIKQECGKDFPVIMRLGLKSYIKGLNGASFDGSGEAGRTLEEGIAICKLLEQYGYDGIDMDMGIYDSFYYACPPSYIQQGFAIDLYAQAKKEISIPVLAGARMQDPYLAEAAIRDGKIDGVVLTRPGLAEPALPRKIQMGKPETIRPCIACCQCFRKALESNEFVTCAVNPELFREADGKLTRTLAPRKIVVIGGGVGGLEAARSAKICGHEVSLYEKADHLGGLMAPAGAQALKKEMHKLIRWYEQELNALGVPVYLNDEMDAQAVKNLHPDAVIMTTAGSPAALSFIPGIDKPLVTDCVTALTDMEKDDFGGKVVVIGGGHVGCEVAMELAVNKGKKVTIVEMMDEILTSVPPVPTPVKMCLTDMIKYYDVDVRAGCALQEVHDDGVVIMRRDGTPETLAADNVVLAAGFRARESFASELNSSGIEVYEIGNGKPTANVLQATHEAYEIVTRL